jgi:excisionase family DNA binding protein
MNTPEQETTTSAAVPVPGIDSTSTASSGHSGNGLDSSSPSAVAASSAALLTPEQLALRLNVSRRCLGNWTRDRIIPMIKIGRVCRFDLPQVMAALEKHVQGAATR